MLDFNASRGTCIARKTYIAILFFHLMDFMKKEEKKGGKKVNRFTRTSSVSRHRFVRIVNGGSQTVRNFSATLRVSR